MGTFLVLFLVNAVVRIIEIELAALDLAMPLMISLRRWGRRKGLRRIGRI
jgi:hypothetical protein